MTEFRSAPLTKEAMNATRITITPFRSQLPRDIVGGSSKKDRAPRSLTLRFGPHTTEADLPTDSRSGKPRSFLRDRGEFTLRVLEAASVGDVVIFERLGSHEFRLHIEKPDGRRVSGAGPTAPDKERIRRWALRETRPEQQEFRRKIAERDGLKCAISGCDIPEVLDAAHLAPRSPGGSDNPSNGIILRADLHRLFDAGLIEFDSVGTAVLDGAVQDPEYRRFHGAQLQIGADLRHLTARDPSKRAS